jgi:hypothetical protein
MREPTQSRRAGAGRLRSGQRDLGAARYEIHAGLPNRPGTVVELESPPSARDGEVLDLTLDDGRVLQIQINGVSPYCRVIGEMPAEERRRTRIPADMPKLIAEGRRRTDARSIITISHPCPLCPEMDVLVTQRGLMLTTLFCLSCLRSWEEPSAVVAAATRTDRRNFERPDSADRRALGRADAPVCTYCSTDANVRTVRRTPEDVYFVCSVCEAMWALPRPDARPGQNSSGLS